MTSSPTPLPLPLPPNAIRQMLGGKWSHNFFLKKGEHFISPASRWERSRVSGKPGHDGSCWAFGRWRVPLFVCHVLRPGNTNPHTGGVFRFKKTQMRVRMVLLGDGKCNCWVPAADRPCYYSLNLGGFIILWFQISPLNISQIACTSHFNCIYFSFD